MLFFYRILTILLWIPIRVLSLSIPAAREFFRVRKEDFVRIRSLPDPDPARKVIWFHASSVGELDQCRALATVFRKRKPETLILQSVFSPSVRESQLDAFPADVTFHLPLDFPWAYGFLFDKFRPRTLVCMAWDRWPNLLLSAKKRGIRTLLACAVITPPAGFLGKKFYRCVFALFDRIYPSHLSAEKNFRELLGQKAEIRTLGDCRIDTVIRKVESNPGSFRRPNGYPFPKVLLLASTYEECEGLFLPLLSEPSLNDFAFWIFPHKTDPARIRSILTEVSRRTENVRLYTSGPFEAANARVVVFDVLGILAFAYQAADFAYVGGGLHHRVHNVLEPAYFGLPILTGPKIDHSPEAKELNSQGGLFIVKNEKDVLETLSLPSERLEKIASSNRAFLESGRGAAERIYEELEK
ncbi:3-deoxy-D-manno-octulosonic acid transferase [Leptospira fluminis]|uniref:3-deoxy-D-manno-octulosonic acid transferase n=1 Tax=Leptospira fluminis TaxID=2484979 RepID=A0A4R9GLY3_9LEPT|nr:glycosyltransferase N-terminal domain-containing protein [Leptospira fluminis]TGK17224.1 3-deoxy-D-manno-octulosonic acid transferase [Leptospira fluminis]